MGIVNLNNRVFIQIIQIAALSRTLIQDKLRAIAHHKILLINPKFSSGLIAVIRIQEQGNILRNILFIKLNAILNNSLVYRIHIKKPQLIRTVLITCHSNLIHPGLKGKLSKLNGIGYICLLQPGLRLNPWILHLLLQIIFKFLFKQPQMIVQANTLATVSERSN